MKTIPISVFADQLDSIQALIGDLVQIESPTTEKAAVDRLGERILQECRELDGNVQVFPQAQSGNHIRCRWGQPPGTANGGEGERGILLLSHMDTVFNLGTLARLPFRLEDQKLWGPGVLDMKSSMALLFAVLRTLRQHGIHARASGDCPVYQ